MIERNTDMNIETKKTRAVKSTMSEQLAGAERRATAQRTQLEKVQLAPDNLTGESSKIEIYIFSRVVTDEEAFTAEIECVARLERDDGAEAEEWQQWLPSRLEMSRTASLLLAEDGESLQSFQTKIATVTAGLPKWCKLAGKTAEKLKLAKAGVVSQSVLHKPIWKKRTLRMRR